MKLILLKHILIIDEKGPNSYQELMNNGFKKIIPAIRPTASEYCGIDLHIGTTGDPKGVLLPMETSQARFMP